MATRSLRPAELVGRAPEARPVRGGTAWFVPIDGVACLLKRYDISWRDPSVPAHHADLVWVHGLLSDLARHGLAVPRPVAAFGGASVTRADGHLWDLTTYQPGQVAGEARHEPLAELGRALARLHRTADLVPPRAQRPLSFAVRSLPQVLEEPRLRDHPDAAALRPVVVDLARDLDALPPARPSPIHGDLTTFNALVDPGGTQIVGLIDFGNAHLDDPVADIAYGLWRSGRPEDTVPQLDLGRVAAVVQAYKAEAALGPGAAQGLPVYLRARGVQMAVKAAWRGVGVVRLSPQVDWIADNRRAIEAAVASACN